MSKREDVSDVVLSYLTLQNRPYSTNDITQNLRDVGKTAVQKALDELVSSKKIMEKVYGKQKVYAPIQKDCGERSEMEVILSELDAKITAGNQELIQLDKKLKAAENELKTLNNEMSTADAAQKLESLTSNILELEVKLVNLKKGVIQISADEKLIIHNQHKNSLSEYRKRKRICMDIANQILENYPKPKKTFFEEVGLETDENDH